MPYHLLLVDDDHYFRQEFKEFLHDVHVIEASNGPEALKILKKPHSIDLIILDEQLPQTRGTDLLKQVHQIAPDVRAIILTGHSSKETAIGAVRGHATDFIEKPLTSKKLNKIRSLVLSAPKGEKDRSIGGIDGKIEQAKYFAQRNYDKKLTLNDVANEVCLSPKYLSRIFKEKTGGSFVDYKLQIRMDKAKELLKESGHTVEEISYKLGYQNPESFGKVFKQLVLMTPSEFREKGQKQKKARRAVRSHTKKDKKLVAEKKIGKKAEKKVKAIEKKLAHVEQQLEEDEKVIEQQAFDLSRLRKKLEQEKYLSDLGRLAATVAHEMRRPLNSIQMAAWNIKRKIEEPSIEGNMACIEEMVEEGERIISNLLNYSRLKMPVYKSCSIKKLLNGCVDTVQKRFSSNNVLLHRNIEALGRKKISTDPLQFKQVLSNIVVNAYEAVSEKKPGKITIDVDVDHKTLTIKIKDNGNGISKNDLDQIFEPFFTRKHKGTGLGLSVCREIIALHNGSITIDSKPNKGSLATIQLPLRKRA